MSPLDRLRPTPRARQRQPRKDRSPCQRNRLSWYREVRVVLDGVRCLRKLDREPGRLDRKGSQGANAREAKLVIGYVRDGYIACRRPGSRRRSRSGSRLSCCSANVYAFGRFDLRIRVLNDLRICSL